MVLPLLVQDYRLDNNNGPQIQKYIYVVKNSDSDFGNPGNWIDCFLGAIL